MAAESWRIVLITPGRRITSSLLPLVSTEFPSAQVIELQGYPVDGKLGDFGHTGVIGFIDLITSEEQGLKALERIVAVTPSIPIVALVPEGSPQLILQAIRAGAKDFLTEPFSNEQFRSVMDKLSLVVPGLGGEQGRIISVIPAKGACGASTIAFNLASLLKKGGSPRTLLADLDPVTGTQAFQMKLKPIFSFIDILSHGSGLDVDVWRGVVQTYSGIDVLLSPDQPIDGAQESGDCRPILDFSRKLYDNIIADFGNPYGEWTLSGVHASDEVFLVTTNELPALQAAQRVMNYYEANGIQRQRIRLVINRFNKDVGLTAEMIEKALQTDVHQLIPSDYESVQRALLDGKPIQTGSAVGKQLLQMSQKILGKDPEKKKPEKSSSTSGLSGLFSLFSRGT